jgi:hypothetical protein
MRHSEAAFSISMKGMSNHYVCSEHATIMCCNLTSAAGKEWAYVTEENICCKKYENRQKEDERQKILKGNNGGKVSIHISLFKEKYKRHKQKKRDQNVY